MRDERVDGQRLVGLVGERHVADDRAARVPDHDNRAAPGVEAVPDRLRHSRPDVGPLGPIGEQDPHVAEPVDEEGVDRLERSEVLERLPRDRSQDPEHDERQDDQRGDGDQEQRQEDHVDDAEEAALGREARHDAPEQPLQLPRDEPAEHLGQRRWADPGGPPRLRHVPRLGRMIPIGRHLRDDERARGAGEVDARGRGRVVGGLDALGRRAPGGDQAQERPASLQQPFPWGCWLPTPWTNTTPIAFGSRSGVPGSPAARARPASASPSVWAIPDPHIRLPSRTENDHRIPPRRTLRRGATDSSVTIRPRGTCPAAAPRDRPARSGRRTACLGRRRHGRPRSACTPRASG